MNLIRKIYESGAISGAMLLALIVFIHYIAYSYDLYFLFVIFGFIFISMAILIVIDSPKYSIFLYKIWHPSGSKDPNTTLGTLGVFLVSTYIGILFIIEVSVIGLLAIFNS